MSSDDSGILEKMLESLSDEEKEKFLNGKINKDLLFKFLNANKQDNVIDNTLHGRVFDFLSQGTVGDERFSPDLFE